MSCCTRACLPRTLSSPLRYPVCQPNLESSAERADVLLSDPPSQVAPLVARAGLDVARRIERSTCARYVSVLGAWWSQEGLLRAPIRVQLLKTAVMQLSRPCLVARVGLQPVSGCSCRVGLLSHLCLHRTHHSARLSGAQHRITSQHFRDPSRT